MDYLSDVFGGWQTRHVANKASKVTFNELSKLSDYELSDIGLARGDIRDVAKAHYDEVVSRKKSIFSSAWVNPFTWLVAGLIVLFVDWHTEEVHQLVCLVAVNCPLLSDNTQRYALLE